MNHINKRSKSPMLRRGLIACFLSLICQASLSLAGEQAPVDSLQRDSVVGLGKRFSFHTNVIDWAIAMPNIGVEFDLSGKETSRYSIGIHAKYRPSLYNKVNPRFVFNTFQLRGEFRRYWRTFVYDDYKEAKKRSRNPVKIKKSKDSLDVKIPMYYFAGKKDAVKAILADSLQMQGRSPESVLEPYHVEAGDTTLYFDGQKYEADTVSESFLAYFYRRYLSGMQQYSARSWRAYYIGLYAELDKFTYNINKHGRQGTGGGFGITMGYTLPIYPMKNGASIDLDLGLSIGARIQSYEKFAYEEETHCYAYTGLHERSFVKHPVLADAHVSLVYRFNSIKNKVKGGQERFERHYEKYKERIKAKKDSLMGVNGQPGKLDRLMNEKRKKVEEKYADEIQNVRDARWLNTVSDIQNLSNGSTKANSKVDKKEQKAAKKQAKKAAKAAAAEEKKKDKDEDKNKAESAKDNTTKNAPQNTEQKGGAE